MMPSLLLWRTSTLWLMLDNQQDIRLVVTHHKLGWLGAVGLGTSQGYLYRRFFTTIDLAREYATNSLRRYMELQGYEDITHTARTHEELMDKLGKALPEEIIARAFIGDEAYNKLAPERKEYTLQCASRAIHAYLNMDKNQIIGDDVLNLDRDTGRVSFKGNTIKLTTKNRKLLHCLMLHPNAVVPCRTLLRDCWGAAYVDQIHYLHIGISSLRKQLDKGIIVTYEGGYMFVPPQLETKLVQADELDHV